MKLFWILILNFLAACSLLAGTLTVDELLERCDRNGRNLDSLDYYAELLLVKDQPKALFEGNFAKGHIAEMQMNITEALDYYRKASSFLQEGDNAGHFRLWRKMTGAFMKDGMYKEALNLCDTFLIVAKGASDSMAQAQAHAARAIAYRQTGRHKRAILSSKQALQLYIEKQSPYQVNAAINVALIYINNGQDSLALQWFYRAYEKSKNFGIDVLTNRCVNNLATLYRNMNQLDSSNHYYQLLLKNESSLRDEQRLLLYQNLARNNITMGKYRHADTCIRAAYAILGDATGMWRLEELLFVDFLLQKGQGNYPRAMQLLDSSMAICQRTGQTNTLLLRYYDKAELLHAMDKPAKAFKALKAYQFMKDSLTKSRDMEAIQKVMAEYQLEEKEAQLSSALAVSRKNKHTTVALLVTLIGLVIVSFLVFRKYRRHTASQFKLEIADGLTASSDSRHKFKRVSEQDSHIVLKSKAVLNLDNLIMVASDGHYSHFTLSDRNKPEIERASLKSYFSKLPKPQFFQSHRSYLVNSDFVKAIYANRILLKNGEEVPLSRTFKNKLRAEDHPLFRGNR